MRRPVYLLALSSGVFVTAHQSGGCSFGVADIKLDLPAADEPCKAHGGTCQSAACSSDMHSLNESCSGLSVLSSATCCAPGPAPVVGVKPGTPISSGANTCNDDACREGCICRSVTTGTGTCEAFCDCSADAGTWDGGDAAPPDAEAPEACGTITCAPGCGCADPTKSKCSCAADACLR